MNFFNLNPRKDKKDGKEGLQKLSVKVLAGIVSGSPIPQFVIDKNHIVIYWNKALAEYSGIKSREAVGTNRQWRAFYDFERPCLADLLVDQKMAMVPKLYKGKYAKSKLIPGSYEAVDFFPAMAGKGKWLYFTASLIKDENGKIIGAVETLEDVTEQKKAEAMLKQHAEKLLKSQKDLVEAVKNLKAERVKLGKEKAKDEAMLMSIGDGLVITDNLGTIILANRVFCDLIGWTLQEIIGQSLAEVMPCFDEKGNIVPSAQRFISRVAKGEKTPTAVFYYTRKDGSRFPGAVTVAGIDFGGQRIGAVSVIRDVTREMEIDRAKTEFISLASHQLRDAPTAISWCAEALLGGYRGALNEKQREYIEEIYTRNRSFIGLINNLLNVSRIDLGTFIIEPEPVSLIDICKSELKQFEAQIKEKNLTVKENYGPEIPIINADPQLLQVVFSNLISNAVYYTPSGGEIAIDLFLGGGKDESGENILFRIADTGCGIPADQQSKIFTRMFRADNAKKIRSGGSGLGLYVAKSIIDQAGFGIGFDSEEGKGTVFTLTIPRTGMVKRSGQTKLTRGII